MQKITLGCGCFWCVEAIFQSLKGVEKVLPGYSGGATAHPSYEEVCSGQTGHAEVVQIDYDETSISFQELMEVFFKTHDPTSLNRQGADVGTQYRSAIFYHTEDQKKKAEEIKKALDQSGAFENKIVTEISPMQNFYPAEKEHLNYYQSHAEQGYCRMVIQPKVEKFKSVFEKRLK